VALNGQPTEAELEAELLRLTRSGVGGHKLQARVTAVRTLLQSRRREREAAEKAEREAERLQRAESRRSVPSWMDPDLTEAEALQWYRLDELGQLRARVEDLRRAQRRWREARAA
jgi:hypothetical protein